MSNLLQTGVFNANNIIENTMYGKQMSVGEVLNPNLVSGNIEIYTNKSGTISSKNTIGNVSSAIINDSVGKIFCLSYEVCASGTRYSTEQGQTAWNQIRYGLHCGCVGTKSDSSTTQFYPFASYLTYSGVATRVYQYWTVPTGYASFSNLTFHLQNYDKPASTNNDTWFLRNFKLELCGTSNINTPYVLKEHDGSGDYIVTDNFIEW